MIRRRSERSAPRLALAPRLTLTLVLASVLLGTGCVRPIRSGRIVPGLEGRELRTIVAADLAPCAFPVSTWELWFEGSSGKPCLQPAATAAGTAEVPRETPFRLAGARMANGLDAYQCYLELRRSGDPQKVFVRIEDVPRLFGLELGPAADDCRHRVSVTVEEPDRSEETESPARRNRP